MIHPSAFPPSRDGYCIFIDATCEGSVPAVTDEKGKPVVHESELEAQREIVDHLITQLQEFLAGERDFDDAMHVGEYIVPVAVYPDGVIVDQSGNTFG